MRKCKICGIETEAIFGIKLQPVPICEYCSTTITMQQVTALCVKNMESEKAVCEKIAKTIVAEQGGEK